MRCFAYGSNMNLTQMKSRCPGAKRIGNGRLEGYEICFPRTSPLRQGKGVASVCEKADTHIEGVVFELTDLDLKRLDECEGVPENYIRKPMKILISNDREVFAETYVAIPMIGGPFKPSKAYMDTIIQGAIENGLPNDYIEKLKGIECEIER